MAETQPASAAHRGRPHLPASLALILACVLSMAAHAPSLGSSFVWDDRILIEAPLVQELHSFGDYFATSFWSPSDTSPDQRMYFRPLSTLSLALDHAAHGSSATGYHLTNLIVHGACVALVFLLGRRLGATPLGALLGALLFGWFPRGSESVDWISGRTDLLATLPALAALLVTMGSGKGRRWLAAGLVLTSLLSKEVGLAAACGASLYELKQPGTLRERVLRLVPLALALAAFALLRVRAIGLLPSGKSLPLGTRALAGIEAIGRYAWMLVDAWHPRLQIGSPVHHDFGFVVAGAVLGVALLGFAGSVVLGRLRLRPEEEALLVTALVAVALVLHVLPIHVNIVTADRFLYLPVACLGASAAAALAALRTEPWGRRATWCVAALAVSYLPVGVERAAIWGDEVRFWTTAFREQRGPQNAMSRVGLGNVLAEYGLYEEAISSLRSAQPGDARNYVLARHNLAGLLAVQGKLDEACLLTERTLALFPLPSLYSKLAMLRAALGRADGANAALESYAARVQDAEKVREAQAQVALAAQLGEELRRTGGTLTPDDTVLGKDLEARLERVRTLLRLQINAVAFKEAVPLFLDPRVGAQRAHHLLLLAVEQAGPNELRQLHERTKAMSPDFPTALDTVVSERLAATARLQAELAGLWTE